MRIPLVRYGEDDAPVAWWEWLFAPVVMPLVFLVLVVAAVVSVPVEFVRQLGQRRHERGLFPRLATVGRTMEWAEVAARLRAGEGTLIVEHRSPQGPVREWWTADDVIGAAPGSLPATFIDAASSDDSRLAEYARGCAARYTDEQSGAGKLTCVPVPLAKRLDPAKYVVVDLGGGWMSAVFLPTGRGLAAKYPAGRVVTLVNWSGNPLLVAGDAAAVFLTRPAVPNERTGPEPPAE